MKLRRSEKLEKLLLDFTDNLAEITGDASGRSLELDLEADERELLETIAKISAVIHPKEPSESLRKKISNAAIDRMKDQLSAEKIQRIVGMAVTMEDFRRNLFADIIQACRNAGFTLTPREVAALRDLREDAVKEFANSLDERITKFFPASLP